jgi:inner membrane protein
MENNIQKVEKLSQTTTWKGVIVGILTILLLIPGAMIENLITERQQRSNETIQKINEKWSNAQTISGDGPIK